MKNHCKEIQIFEDKILRQFDKLHSLRVANNIYDAGENILIYLLEKETSSDGRKVLSTLLEFHKKLNNKDIYWLISKRANVQNYFDVLLGLNLPEQIEIENNIPILGKYELVFLPDIDLVWKSKLPYIYISKRDLAKFHTKRIIQFNGKLISKSMQLLTGEIAEHIIAPRIIENIKYINGKSIREWKKLPTYRKVKCDDYLIHLSDESKLFVEIKSTVARTASKALLKKAARQLWNACKDQNVKDSLLIIIQFRKRIVWILKNAL